jgi:hypothetical protein
MRDESILYLNLCLSERIDLLLLITDPLLYQLPLHRLLKNLYMQDYMTIYSAQQIDLISIWL